MTTPDPLRALLAVAQANDRAAAAALLDRDPSLAAARNAFGTSAIHAAHFAGADDVVGLLTARGVERDVWLSAELGMVDRLAALLDADPEAVTAFRPNHGGTLLHAAAYWGQVDASRLLLARGADATVASRDTTLQIHPLGSAVASADIPNPSRDEDVVLALVDLLLDAGADVNARRLDGLTALHTAAFRGHARVVERLLARGADPTIAGRDPGPHAGERPIAGARRQGHADVVGILKRATGEA